MLRIYVSGAHSTGKTTLARHIAEETGLPLINEVARQVQAEMELSFESLRVNLKLVGEYQRAVFKRQVEIEENYPQGFVSDRTFCNLAYAARHSLVLSEILATAEPYFKHVSSALVFFVRPQRDCMVNDGTREQVDWDEINRIDGILDFMFEAQSVPRVGIAERNMKDRVRTAMAAVNLYKRASMADDDHGACERCGYPYDDDDNADCCGDCGLPKPAPNSTGALVAPQRKSD